MTDDEIIEFVKEADSNGWRSDAVVAKLREQEAALKTANEWIEAIRMSVFEGNGNEQKVEGVLTVLEEYRAAREGK